MLLWLLLSREWQPTPVFLPGKSHGQEPGKIQSMGLQSRTQLRTDTFAFTFSTVLLYTGKTVALKIIPLAILRQVCPIHAFLYLNEPKFQFDSQRLIFTASKPRREENGKRTPVGTQRTASTEIMFQANSGYIMFKWNLVFTSVYLDFKLFALLRALDKVILLGKRPSPRNGNETRSQAQGKVGWLPLLSPQAGDPVSFSSVSAPPSSFSFSSQPMYVCFSDLCF